jgi:peroxiredoxin
MTYRFVFAKTILYLFLFSYLTSFAQKGYEINVSFQQNTDTLFYLARYQSGKIYMVDTSALPTRGLAHFMGEKKLEPGVYILASAEKTKLLEIIVDQVQHFEIKVEYKNGANNHQVTGSKENELFLTNLEMTAVLGKTFRQIEEIKQNAESIENLKVYQSTLDSIDREIKIFREFVISEYPEMLLSKIFLAMTEVVIPDSIKSLQPDAYLYYRAHYWDKVDFTDERLLATPLIPRMLQTYFEQVLPQIADSIIPEIDKLISRSSENIRVRDYLIWHFTTAYQSPKIMGLDKVFVHMADAYFSKEPISNTSEEVLQRILSRADQLRKLLVGVKAPDLILIDTNDNFISFRSIESRFTVLFFWDHTCGFCKQDLNNLKLIYDKGKYDLEIYAIGTNSELDKWKDYIKKENLNWINVNGTRSVSPNFHDLYDIYATPVIYLLDADKKIIAKKIDVSQLEMILDDKHQ